MAMENFAKPMEPLLKKYAEDREEYLRTGELDSFVASIFARKLSEVMDVGSNVVFKILLDGEIDPIKLREAVAQATKMYPYTGYRLRFNSYLPWVSYVKDDAPIPVLHGAIPKQFGTEETEGKFTFVSYDGSEVTFAICHAITDGSGMFAFINAVLSCYHGTLDNAVYAEELKDYVADPVKYELPLPDDYVPMEYGNQEIFRIPAAQRKEGAVKRIFHVSRESFRTLKKKYNVSGQATASFILAKAVQKANPANSLPILVRSPIDTRKLFQIPNTFQNASLPHVYLKADPARLMSSAETPKVMIEMSEDLKGQLEYENMARFTNQFAAAIKGGEQQLSKVLLDYVGRTELLTSSIGRVFAPEIDSHIRKMQITAAGFPIMLHVYEYGDKVCFNYVQDFDSNEYITALQETLQELYQEVWEE